MTFHSTYRTTLRQKGKVQKLDSRTVGFEPRFDRKSQDLYAFNANGANIGYNYVPATVNYTSWAENTHTIEFVIKDFESQVGTGYINYFHARYIVGVTANNVYWRMHNGAFQDITVAMPAGIDKTKWVYVRLEYSKELAKRRIIVNDTTVYDAAAPTNFFSTNTLWYLMFCNNTANGNFFKGACRSITVYDRLLSTEEIEHRYTPAGGTYERVYVDPNTGSLVTEIVDASEPTVRLPLLSDSLTRPIRWYEFEKSGCDYGRFALPSILLNNQAFISV